MPTQQLYSLSQAAEQIGRPLSVVSAWVTALGLDWTLGEKGSKLINQESFDTLRAHAASRPPYNTAHKQNRDRERQKKLPAL